MNTGDAAEAPSDEQYELAPVDQEDRDQGVEEVEAPARVKLGAQAEDDEARMPRVGRRPLLPTKAEIEEHFPLHLQYRDWCEHCVRGKGRLAQHRVEPSDREKFGVTIHMDYAYGCRRI